MSLCNYTFVFRIEVLAHLRALHRCQTQGFALLGMKDYEMLLLRCYPGDQPARKASSMLPARREYVEAYAAVMQPKMGSSHKSRSTCRS